MMGAFGRFLEVSVPAPDVLRSLAFYRALGFAELTTGDIRSWHYAVVTDGTIAIGLHGGGIEEPALTFVRPNLARQIAALESAGQQFEFRRLGAEEFNEAGLRSPDGHLILMIEARTWSPGAGDSATGCLLGSCTAIRQACLEPEATRRFYEAAGFLATEPEAEPLRLHTPGITLALQREPLRAGATLHFSGAEAGATRRRLEEAGLPVGRAGADHVVTAPEGTRLIFASG